MQHCLHLGDQLSEVALHEGDTLPTGEPHGEWLGNNLSFSHSTSGSVAEDQTNFKVEGFTYSLCFISDIYSLWPFMSGFFHLACCFWGSSPFVAYVSTSFLFMVEWYGYHWETAVSISGCFHLWGIANSTAVNIYVQGFLWASVFNSFWYISLLLSSVTKSCLQLFVTLWTARLWLLCPSLSPRGCSDSCLLS